MAFERMSEDRSTPSNTSGDINVKMGSSGMPMMYPAVVACYLGALAIGTVIGYPAMALEKMTWAGSALALQMQSSESQTWFASCMALGALPGAIVAGPLCNSVGRRSTILLSSVPFVIGWMSISWASSLSTLIIGRMITGVCTGMLCVAVPVYIVEVSTKEKRGLLGGLFGGTIATGIFFCGFFGGPFLDWSPLAVLCASLPLAMGIFMFFMPESPKLYLAKGLPDEAIRAFKTLHGEDMDAVQAIKDIQRELDEQPKGRLTIAELKAPSAWKSALAATILMILQQYTGMNAVMTYAVQIFKNANSSLSPMTCTLLIQGIQAIFTLSASSITNRFGRRIPLIFSAISMLVSMTVFGIYQYANQDHLMNDLGLNWLPVVCIVIAVIGFSVGFGPLPWLVIAELAPLRVAGLVSMVATAVNWGGFFILTKTFDLMVMTLNTFGTYWFYGCFSLAALLYVVFCLPETHGKTSEEIKKLLDGDYSYANDDIESGETQKPQATTD